MGERFDSEERVMGVYIRGMEMPNTCEECNLDSFCDKWIEARKMCGEWELGVKATIRHPDCPLVPVPEPHGWLIDETNILKVFSEEVWGFNTDFAKGMQSVLTEIRGAPTIVPATNKE